jgi:NADP-dependent 3-hydroxy acid dehydrogenase YdfG
MTGQVLFITGASTGIGEATARAAAKAGWRVALFARSADKLAALAGEIGDAALALPGDAASLEDQTAAIGKTIRAFGGLDAAFANAGLGSTAPGVEGGDVANWREMIEVNIWGLMMTAKAALPELRKTNGHFVMTGSNAGRRAAKGSVYGATKWFVTGFGANLRHEMAEWGGRTTIIEPGMTDTPFFSAPKPTGLRAEDVADAVLHALSAPARVNVDEIRLTPTGGLPPG